MNVKPHFLIKQRTIIEMSYPDSMIIQGVTNAIENITMIYYDSLGILDDEIEIRHTHHRNR